MHNQHIAIWKDDNGDVFFRAYIIRDTMDALAFIEKNVKRLGFSDDEVSTLKTFSTIEEADNYSAELRGI